MNKILAVFDGTLYSESASKYAMELARKTKAHLVGAFIHDLRYVNYTYAYAWDQPVFDLGDIEKTAKEDQDRIKTSIELFKSDCAAQGIRSSVHMDKGIPLQEVIHESVFADVAVVDAETGFFSFSESAPSAFLKDLLADSHCPVMIVPHQYHDFRKIILCYDGSPSCVYAMKMFAYLFPDLHNLGTSVVSVNKNSSNHLKDGSKLKEMIRQHFVEANYEVLNGKPEEELLNFLKLEGDGAIVVMGAYGRNTLSRLFHQSLSNRVIKELKLPVFITHQ
jgi:nucleotide-binding universal stress UspA family protein